MATPGKKPVVLHIGDPIKYNPDTYAAFSTAFDVIRPSAAERQRPEFIRALKDRRWGDFSAIFRPFWSTGGEMGKWDAELISLLPASCRVFASAGAGFDWADTKLLGERGVIYCNGGLAAAESVADFAVALVISTFRHLAWSVAAAVIPPLTSSDPADAEAAFRFSHEHEVFHSHNPRGHALGLIGLGKIGQLVADKLGNPSMGMVLHYYDVVRRPEADEKRMGLTYHPSLASLLAASDCAVLCTPASADGKPLINAAALASMKPGGRFVNIARGSLVDEDALADALESGRVSAAGLDVHADEPRVSKRLLEFAGAQLKSAGPQGGKIGPDGKAINPGRVLLTCHNAGGTVETHIGFEELAMRNIMAVLEGKQAITPVNMHFLNKKDSKL
ncbi:d-isomer specific 2-hydroxyacid dehydrogenase [Diaporthe amygdali]|uniref:d-isomer specific 2-hydroxyacid dehydrogenase n=1 Tax=Phomopsis amygdali TaxID=1214568 RepID=UPI0022FDCF44|nr:d-isomer specific 2-hydroxyacid dehydrogenase [Diaporthe amygdali]KAJ0114850.1 d-isomer specific 2-hydroxyacid dehydrogenase [Diaporthe amygdali]